MDKKQNQELKEYCEGRGLNPAQYGYEECNCVSMNYEQAYHKLLAEKEEVEKINCILRKEKAELERAIIDLVLRRIIL